MEFPVTRSNLIDGRTTDAQDPGATISGAQLDCSAYLQPCLASHPPVDLVVSMLGTNDLEPVFNRTPLASRSAPLT
jgi:lysophospholipase L1-like esterase